MKQKLKAIHRLLKSSDYSLVTVSNDDISVVYDFGDDLTNNMVLATTVKGSFNVLTSELEVKAVAAGEIRMLQSLKETVEKVKADVGQ